MVTQPEKDTDPVDDDPAYADAHTDPGHPNTPAPADLEVHAPDQGDAGKAFADGQPDADIEAGL